MYKTLSLSSLDNYLNGLSRQFTHTSARARTVNSTDPTTDSITVIACVQVCIYITRYKLFSILNKKYKIIFYENEKKKSAVKGTEEHFQSTETFGEVVVDVFYILDTP